MFLQSRLLFAIFHYICKQILPTDSPTKLLLGTSHMLSSCSIWLEPGAAFPYFCSLKEWHIPCLARKEDSFCLLQVSLEHGELCSISLRTILRDSLERDLVWGGVHNVQISHEEHCNEKKWLKRSLSHISMAGPIQESLGEPPALGLRCQELCEVAHFSLWKSFSKIASCNALGALGWD